MTTSLIIPLLIAGLIASIIIWARFVTPYLLSKKIVASRRSIEWLNALQRTLAGKGFFVIHRKRLWWVEGNFPDKGIQVYATTEEKGLLVLAHPKKKLLDLLSKEAPGKFATIDAIPFTDPEIKK